MTLPKSDEPKLIVQWAPLNGIKDNGDQSDNGINRIMGSIGSWDQ